MNEKLIKYLPGAIGAVLGAVGGFLYYHFVGCKSGTCGIKSSPVYMTILGALIGYLVVDTAKDIVLKIKKKKDKE